MKYYKVKAKKSSKSKAKVTKPSQQTKGKSANKKVEAGEENFFQRALDRDIPVETYFHGEREILNIIHKLYENNKKSDIVGYIGSHGGLITNTYAKMT